MNEPRTEGCAEGDDRGSSPNAGHDPGDASPDAIAIAALLRASDLPARWRNRSAFTLLSIGAASLALLEAIEAAWGADPEHCERLDAIVVDAPWPLHPPGGEWPPATPGLHRIERAGGRIQWLFAHGDGERALRELVANVDAFILVDGSCSADLAGSAAATQPSRSFDRLEIRSAVDRALRPGLFVRQPDAVKALARLAAPGASLVVNCADAALIARLRSAGFAARNARERPDAAGDVAESRARPREGTVTAFHADLNPTRAVRRPPGRPARAVHRERRVVIVGAGLAGCAAAWAFAQHGWTSTLLERQSSVAAGASGNPAGLFHGIVNGVDGLHARFNRAAALEARAAVAVAVRDHAAAGAHDGLLQCVETGSDLDAMRALLVRLRLPAEWVVAVDAREASDAAGIPLTRPAWFHAQGGWVEPVELCRSYLERAGAAVALRFGQAVASLRREGDAWTLLDAEGLRLESAPIVVLANAGAAFELIGATGWPVEAVRGQLSVWRHAAAEGVLAPRLPIAGAGYVVPALDGGLVFGATAFAHDAEASVRASDHRLNLAQLEALSPAYAGVGAKVTDALEGRTAWRCVSRDRLPIIGAVPTSQPDGSSIGGTDARRDQPRLVPREPGLFLFSALGSRGISWSALGAQVLAALVTGAPSPIEASLLDAVDPARFQVRDARRQTARKPRPAQGGESGLRSGSTI